MTVWIYRGSRRAETYLYLAAPDDFARVPEALLRALGRLELVMELELDAGRKLARAEAGKVLEAVDRRGFYLQLPPVDTPGEPRVH